MNITREIFELWDKHLLYDDKPSNFLNSEIEKADYFDRHPFIMLRKLREIPQSPEHHPEGNVWNHTLLVVDEAAKRKNESEDKRAFMWAALLHDIGKAPTTITVKGKIVAYDHDNVGAKMAVEFLEALIDDEEFIDKVAKLVRWHMQILFVAKDLPFADLDNMMKEISYKEVALLGICDRLGRGELTQELIEKEIETVEFFVRKCEERTQK